MMDLEEATRIASRDGVYTIELSNKWEIWGPNGGYLAAIALRAASMIAEIRQPASLYCHFLSSPKFDEVTLRVEMLKKGRRSESLSVQMLQQGKPVLQALIRTATDAPGVEHQQAVFPAVPPPDGLKTYDEIYANESRPRYTFWDNLEARPIDQAVLRNPQPAIVRDWVRFQPRACFDDKFVDAARSLILLDTYGWPAAYRSYPGTKYYAPNLDTTAWFHNFSPQCEWLLIDHSCPIATRGLLGVQGQVWDANGKLLATGSAQLCCLPLP